ncbi:MAG: Bug family tripartite tricarboxylate transporter substrate binding protein, partial [Pseudorhodoplanes sp.]
KIYAISEPTRYSSIPNIPTISETLAGFSLSPWLGFLAPAATPKDIIARLNKEITEALKQPDVKQRLVALGLTPIGSSSETAKTLILKDLKIRGDLVQSAKIEKVQ